MLYHLDILDDKVKLFIIRDLWYLIDFSLYTEMFYLSVLGTCLSKLRIVMPSALARVRTSRKEQGSITNMNY